MSADTGALVPLPGTAVLMMLDPHAAPPEPPGPRAARETDGDHAPDGGHTPDGDGGESGPSGRLRPKGVPGRPAPTAPRRLALARVTRALHVIFGVCGPRALESAAYGRQVRLHAAARRAERAAAHRAERDVARRTGRAGVGRTGPGTAATSPTARRAATEVRVLSLHLRPAPAPDRTPGHGHTNAPGHGRTNAPGPARTTARTPGRGDGDAPAPGRGAGASEINGRVEVFGSCRVDGRVHAFVACLDGGRLDVLRVG